MLSILVDTNVIFNAALNRKLSRAIKKGTVQVYVPTLIHAERVRQLATHYGQAWSLDFFRQQMQATGFEILSFSTEDAEKIAEIWIELGVDESYWKGHKFDILLCCIARSRGLTLVTDDQGKHFKLIENRIGSSELENLL